MRHVESRRLESVFQLRRSALAAPSSLGTRLRDNLPVLRWGSMAQPTPVSASGQSPTLRRVSGVILFLGVALLGVPFLLLGVLVGHTYSNASVNEIYQTMYTCWGLGVIVIGGALAIARM